MKPALLVIDVQNLFFKNSPVASQSLNNAIRMINRAIALFREKQLPVICIQQMDKEQNLVPGESDFDTPANMDILPGDIHIHKRYRNSFNQTSLADILREKGVDTVIVTGYSAEYCVLSTAWGAEDLDLTPILLRGALASGSQENIRFVESVNDLITYKALVKAVDK